MKYLRHIKIALVAIIIPACPGHAAPQGGDVDLNFGPGLAVDGPVYSVAVQTDGRMLIGGSFTSVGGMNRSGIARLNADGSLDNGFQNGLYDGVAGSVYSIALQTNGQVLIGGYFVGVNEIARGGIARLNADGSLDTGFQGGMNGADIYICDSIFYPCQSYVATVRSIALQSAGKVFLGGGYNRVNKTTHNGIALLDTNGNVDTSFLDHWTGASYPTDFAVAAQPDGKVIVGGDFGITRLNPDGRRDTNFQSVVFGGGSYVYSVVLQPNGKMLIGGAFTSINGTNRNRLARLNANGTLDPTFQNGMSGADDQVYALALQPNGKVLVGGPFYSINGVARSGIARLNADGGIDMSFLDGMTGTDDSVTSIALQADGGILIGGFFTSLNGVAVNYIARLYGTAPLLLSDFGVTADEFKFNVNGESNQVVVVEGSTNLVNWTSLKTNTLNTASMSFTDSVSTDYPKRFYRARLQ